MFARATCTSSVSLILMSLLLLPGLVSLAVALAAMPLVIAAAHRRGLVSQPRDDRWSQRTVALMGGVGIFAGVVGGVAAWLVGGEGGVPLWLAAGAVLIFAAGVYDDLHEIRPVAKMLVQIVAAALPVAFGVSFGDSLPLFASVPLTLFWIVGVTNALNLIDGMDGLAGGIAAIASFILALLAFAFGANDVAAWMLVVTGAAIGFLAYNVRPARIFMGDSGSLFLGYLLATSALLVQPLGEGRLDRLLLMLVPLAVLAVPILDTTFVTVARLVHGRRVSVGGNDHVMHRLVHLGLSENRTVATLWGLSAVAGALALVPLFVRPEIAYVLAAAYGALVLVLAVQLAQADVYGHRQANADPHERLAANRIGTLLHSKLGHEWKALLGMTADVALVAAALFGADLLHGRTSVWARFSEDSMLVPGVIVVKISVFYGFWLYRGIWRYAGTPELLRIASATVVSSALAWTFVAVYAGLGAVSVPVAIIDAMLTFFVLAGVRMGLRGVRHAIFARRLTDGTRAMLYGAGDSGLLLMRELRQNDEHGLDPVGFLDDDPLKQGMLVQGVRVLGGLASLAAACALVGARTVVITAHRIPLARRREIEAACTRAGLACRMFAISLDTVDLGHRTVAAPVHTAVAAARPTGGDGGQAAPVGPPPATVAEDVQA